ncbi:hypothetical protein HDU76_010419, partial [Blyttiomyces sp. JEL0837]
MASQSSRIGSPNTIDIRPWPSCKQPETQKPRSPTSCRHPWHKWVNLTYKSNDLCAAQMYREAADTFLQAYRQSDHQTFDRRFQCLCIYCAILILKD